MRIGSHKLVVSHGSHFPFALTWKKQESVGGIYEYSYKNIFSSRTQEKKLQKKQKSNAKFDIFFSFENVMHH